MEKREKRKEERKVGRGDVFRSVLMLQINKVMENTFRRAMLCLWGEDNEVA